MDKRSIKKFAIILILLSISYAKADSTSVYLKKGDSSLQFQINEQFKFSGFQGSIISAKYLLSNKTAIRAGFSLFYNHNDERTTTKLNEKDTFSIMVHPQYLNYLANQQLTMYWGMGLRLKYDYSSLSKSNKQPYESDYSEYMLVRTWKLGTGISAVIGGEYFVTDYLSLILEYGILLEYLYSEQLNLIYGVTEFNEFSFQPLKIKFGLSLNF